MHNGGIINAKEDLPWTKSFDLTPLVDSLSNSFARRLGLNRRGFIHLLQACHFEEGCCNFRAAAPSATSCWSSAGRFWISSARSRRRAGSVSAMRPWPPVFPDPSPAPLPLPSSGRRWSFTSRFWSGSWPGSSHSAPLIPFWTPHWASQEELADSRLSQEYAVFRKAVLRDRFPTPSCALAGTACPLIRPVIPSG